MSTDSIVDSMLERQQLVPYIDQLFSEKPFRRVREARHA